MPALTNTTARPLWCGNVRLIPGQSDMVADEWMQHKRMQALLESGDVKPAAEQQPARQAQRPIPQRPIPQPPRQE